MKSKDTAIVGILLTIGAILRFFLALLHTPLTPVLLSRDHPYQATSLRSPWYRDCCRDPVHDDLKFTVSTGKPFQ